MLITAIWFLLSTISLNRTSAKETQALWIPQRIATFPPKRLQWTHKTMFLRVCGAHEGDSVDLRQAAQTASAEIAKYTSHVITPVDCEYTCSNELCGELSSLRLTLDKPAYTRVRKLLGKVVSAHVYIDLTDVKGQHTVHAILLHEFLHIYGLTEEDNQEDSMANFYLIRSDVDGSFYQELNHLQLTNYDLRDLKGYTTLPGTAKESVGSQRIYRCRS